MAGSETAGASGGSDAGGATTVAIVELVRGDDVVRVGGLVVDGARPGLDAVDRVLRLQLAVAPFGWRVRIADVDPRLRRLLSLVGVPVELSR